MLYDFEYMHCNNVIVYNGLGAAESYGTKFDVVIEHLKSEPTPAIEVDCTSKMVPFIFGDDEKLHPLFEEDCDLKDPFCYNYEYSPTRVKKELFNDCVLDIIIIDQIVESAICHLYYRYEELRPDGWEFIDDFALARNNLRAFLQILHRIQYASLTELLA